MSGIGVLGPIQVADENGELRTVRSRHQRLLLAVLVSRRGRPVPADELVEALWGDDLPEHPMAALQSHVFRLRRVVATAGCELHTEGSGYRFACERDLLDAARFEHLIAEANARVAEPAVAVEWLDEALGLWRGRAYLGVADHDALRADAVRLEERRAEAAERRAELLAELGRTSEAATAAEALMSEHPFRERPVVIRMRTLAGEGRHADALAVFERFRRLLGEELGLEPSPELRSLEGDILRHEVPATPAVGLPGNSLIGREVDLAELVARLESVRLVTLTGTGGVGKSRLALHCAARTAHTYPDGVWLCELATVSSDDAVAPTVASVLHVQPRAGQSHAERVAQYLRTRRSLLVLDNCEHVRTGAAALAALILSRTPDVDVLATSRTRLGVEGEHVAPVMSLAVPERDELTAPAVALLVDRARAVRPTFEVTVDNAATVADLCRCLDGLPLAIELAAARMVSRTPAEILDEFGDRVDRLADPRRARERHRSMEAVVGWSYERLDDTEQDLLRHAAVFAGGFTGDAVAEVFGTASVDVTDVLASLVEHSLVDAHEACGRTRFSMLEPVRQFVETQLSATVGADVRARHAAWAAQWMEHADRGLRSAAEPSCAEQVRAELANMRAAVRWSIDNDIATAARIVSAVYWYAYWYGAPETFDWAEAVVRRHDEAPPATLAGAYATAALGAWRRGDPRAARALAQRGIDDAETGDPVAARFVWEALSGAEMLAGNYERALHCQHQSLELARAAGDHVQEAREHIARAIAFGYLGHVDDALAELDAAAHTAVVSGCPTMDGFREYAAGELTVDTSPREALPHLRRARDTARRIGNRYLAAIAGVSALSTAARAGDMADALSGFAELLDYFDRAGSRAQQWIIIRSLIETLTARRNDEPAAVLWAALTTSPNAPPLIGADAIRMSDAVAILSTRLGEDRFEALTSRGAELGDDDAIAFARRSTDEAQR